MAFTQLAIELAFLLLWAYALIKLYSDVKESEKLLPNKKLFVLHGSLLTGFLVMNIAAQTTFLMGNQAEPDSIR